MEQHRSPLSGRETMSPWVHVIQNAKLLGWSFLPAEEFKSELLSWLEQVRSRGMALNVQQSSGQSGVPEGASSCSGRGV